MVLRLRSLIVAGALLVLPLAGCSGPSAGVDEAHAKPEVRVHKAHYRIDINYPTLPDDYSALIAGLHDKSDTDKKRFHKLIKQVKTRRGSLQHTYALEIAFRVVDETSRFLSVRERGAVDVRGVRPLPVTATFVYDKKTDRMVPFEALFKKPAKTRKRLADYARRRLYSHLTVQVPGGREAPAAARKAWIKQMRNRINKGTQPLTRHYDSFTVLGDKGDKAVGLEFIFEAGQVAPSSYGVQKLSVPTTVFADYLKPSYRKAFD